MDSIYSMLDRLEQQNAAVQDRNKWDRPGPAQQNPYVKDLPDGNMVYSQGVAIPGLNAKEHYAYTPDQRDAYAEKIKQALIEEKRAEAEYQARLAEDPESGIVNIIRGLDSSFRNMRDPNPSREYMKYGNAVDRKTQEEKDAASGAQEKKDKLAHEMDIEKLKSRTDIKEAEINASTKDKKAEDYTKDRTDYGKWYSDNMSGAGGDPVKARILGEQLWDVQNADKINAKVFTDPQTGDIKLKYKDGGEIIIPASELAGTGTLGQVSDVGRDDWRKQNQRIG
jgi:hypothetical protein